MELLQSVFPHSLLYNQSTNSPIESVMDVKGEINKVMEKLKKEGSIKSGLELDVSLSDAGMKCNDVETG